ncbi:fatty acid desaturase [Hyphomicrobium sp. LHD-15]|uniref:fatty acid desaturase family protein n=1 Tax=Hyphomicrobium sp. LHD-15 TaxID=3072142 RepID=UPI00280C8179|nr:fatty acid desaturase [Hyphomicrobium sp. LHD-15]MDQ8698055.1 fatty acid desaturase [Hyphomicrobium sp. LHD-15]
MKSGSDVAISARDGGPSSAIRDASSPARSGADSEAVRDLKARDNTTNWLHLLQIYAVIAITIALAIEANEWIDEMGYGWGWIVAVNTMAALVLGAAQHQFGGAIHEGTHFLLFKNRKLNEVASDWLAAFPIYTSTYQFRLHHLAHHQFVNDPERDPDIAQLKESGHWLDFPVPSIELLWGFLKRLSPVKLFLFTVFRAKYSAVGFDEHAYIDPAAQGSKWPLRVGILYAVAAPIATVELIRFVDARLGCAVLIASTIVAIAYLLLAPESAFTQTRLAPVISHRATMLSRVVYFAILYGTLTYLTVSGIAPAWKYFNLYWVIPLFTSFPLFMMLRQWVQHGNADRGRYTNTRVFLTGPLVRYAVFPWGMDYHLPHHLMASVPHYNLKRLHELLLADPTYREKGVVLHGFFASSEGPSALEALGPAHAPASRERAYVDNAALEYAELRDANGIAREAARSEQAS